MNGGVLGQVNLLGGGDILWVLKRHFGVFVTVVASVFIIQYVFQ